VVSYAKLLRYLGAAIDIGPAMTRKILKKNGSVMYRTSARPLTPDEIQSPTEMQMHSYIKLVWCPTFLKHHGEKEPNCRPRYDRCISLKVIHSFFLQIVLVLPKVPCDLGHMSSPNYTELACPSHISNHPCDSIGIPISRDDMKDALCNMMGETFKNVHYALFPKTIKYKRSKDGAKMSTHATGPLPKANSHICSLAF
jgi:hypothetical protein